MSDFSKRVHEYRRGNDWKTNFRFVNYPNIEASLRSILTKREPEKVYDRLGNHVGSTGRLVPLSLDEKIFRIAVLMDTQLDPYPGSIEEAMDVFSDPLPTTNTHPQGGEDAK